MKISQFQSKDVINIIDGKKLGNVSDIELDIKHGKINAVIVPQLHRKFGIFGAVGSDIVIPWENVVKIGHDVVLVRVDELRTIRGPEVNDLHA